MTIYVLLLMTLMRWGNSLFKNVGNEGVTVGERENL